MPEVEKEWTDAEIDAHRQAMRDESDAALKRLDKFAGVVTKRVLADILTASQTIAMDFTVRHVAKRAVLRAEVQAAIPKWSGIFDEHRAYDAGSVVACAHALWVAEEDTGCRPNSKDSGWRLILKSPR